MNRMNLGLLWGAAALAAPLFSASPACAHAVCGDRIFPATLGIDDPGVGDELALPTVTYLPENGDGSQEFDATFNYTKTIFPGFGLSVGTGPSWLSPGGYGWGTLSTEAKWNFLCVPQWELMASAGFEIDWGHTGTGSQAQPFNNYSPVLDVGFGFGSLPTSMNFLRPLAVTAEVSGDLPGASSTNGAPNSNAFNWGFTIQYSLPYFNSHVSAIDNDFLKHLIPITEFTFSRPVGNFLPGTNVTTGTIQPGVIYAADKWQFALEAVIPQNSASGKGVGVVGELHFYFDDIFPNSLGKPIFGGKL